MTAALSTSQRVQCRVKALGMRARLVAAGEGCHAARADRRMGGVRPNVGAVVPAALAFLLGQWKRFDADAAGCRGKCGGARSDEDVFEVVAEARQELEVALLGGVDPHAGLQRGTDPALGAQRLELLGHLAADFAQPPPALGELP